MRFADAYDPIRAIKSSWKLLTPSALPLLIGGVILMVTDGQSGFGIHDGPRHQWHAGAVLFFVGLFGCIGLVCFLISSWISAGMANAVEKTVFQGAADIGDVFESRGRFLNVILVRLLLLALSIAALLPLALIVGAAVLAHATLDAPKVLTIGGSVVMGLLYLPVLVYVLLGLSLARFAVVFEDLGPTAAISRSWQLVKGNRLSLFVYWIVMVVFTLLGLCACFVGVFFTGSLSIIAANESYLAIVKPEEYGRSWLANNRMPSSVAYSASDAAGRASAGPQDVPPFGSSAGPSSGSPSWGNSGSGTATTPPPPPPPPAT